MAKRTIQSCWKQYERFVRNYSDESKDQEVALAKIQELTEKANAEDLCESLYTLFVKPFLPLELTVEFSCMFEDDGSLPRWKTKYDSEGARIMIHPITTVQFLMHIEKLKLTDDDYDDFLRCRWLSFLVELGKLPSIYVMFMLVLQRVAYLLEIAHLEKRGGIVEVAEGENYHTMLWAFKELEQFASKTWGVEIRSHYGISWYESEWITGR